MKSAIPLIFILLFCLSCNQYKFIVKQENVVYDKTGYLCIIDNRSFFIEAKDSILNSKSILNRINRQTFWLPRLPSDQTNAFKMISKKAVVKNLYDDANSLGMVDTIYFSFIRLRAYHDIETLATKNNMHENTSSYYIKLLDKIYCIRNNYFDQIIVYYYPINPSHQERFIQYLKNIHNSGG